MLSYRYFQVQKNMLERKAKKVLLEEAQNSPTKIFVDNDINSWNQTYSKRNYLLPTINSSHKINKNQTFNCNQFSHKATTSKLQCNEKTPNLTQLKKRKQLLTKTTDDSNKHLKQNNQQTKLQTQQKSEPISKQNINNSNNLLENSSMKIKLIKIKDFVTQQQIIHKQQLIKSQRTISQLLTNYQTVTTLATGRRTSMRKVNKNFGKEKQQLSLLAPHKSNTRSQLTYITEIIKAKSKINQNTDFTLTTILSKPTNLLGNRTDKQKLKILV